ncbi:MAG: STAS domain-containing protein [Acidobacteria bacterium]|nr:STAS domain-containing protein [Acidobacteriota bacterium]
MNIATRTVNGVSVLDMSGRLVLGESNVALRETIRDLVTSGQKHILLNMEGVSHVDSNGIGELINAYVHVKSQGGQLKLLNLTKNLHELLAITKLLTVFDCYENEGLAVQSFGN